MHAGKRIVRDGYDRVARAYLESRSADGEDVQLLRELVAHLRPGARVLDAGCGAGVPISALLSRHASVVGVDISETQLRLARERVPGAAFAQADLSKLCLAGESFDAVCSYYAIIHVPREEHPQVLRELQRVLKPDGYALLCMGNGDLPDDVAHDYFDTTMYWSHYDAATNVRLVGESGFDVLWSRPVADYLEPKATHLFILAQKAEG